MSIKPADFANATAFNLGKLAHFSKTALEAARAELSATLKAGLCPDTHQRRGQYEAAIKHISNELERRKGKGNSTCTRIVTRPVKVGKLNIVTGESSFEGGEAYDETAPCGVPLFSQAERLMGVCRSCAKEIK